MISKKYIFIILFALFYRAFNAQVEVHAVIDTNILRIGEQTRLDIYLNYNSKKEKNIFIEWPNFEDTIIKQIEILSISKIDTTFPDKNNSEIIQQHLQLTITSFDSGYYAIPSFKFIINKDSSNFKLTEILMLEVRSVPTDTSIAKVKDIKVPFDEPFDWRWYLPYAYWGLGILALAIILFIVIKKLTKKQPLKVVEDNTPKIPPHIRAFEALEKIKEEAVWKNNKTKEYYSAITDTIRLYIEERFKINALELTSDEIIKVFKYQVIDGASREKLVQILTLSDFVKFAKQIPIEAEHTLTLNNAFEFVRGTLREEEENLNQKTSV
ncbi:MAG: hypothetical protein ACK504_02840 [Bacteroidota bacterium]